MKLIFKYLRPLWRSLTWGLTIKVLATLAELTLPYILSHKIDTLRIKYTNNTSDTD